MEQMANGYTNIHEYNFALQFSEPTHTHTNIHTHKYTHTHIRLSESGKFRTH